MSGLGHDSRIFPVIAPHASNPGCASRAARTEPGTVLPQTGCLPSMETTGVNSLLLYYYAIVMGTIELNIVFSSGAALGKSETQRANESIPRML